MNAVMAMYEGRFSIFVLVFVSRNLELGAVPAVSPATKKFFLFQ